MRIFNAPTSNANSQNNDSNYLHPYRLGTYPEVNYRAHPAYGGLFRAPTLSDRLAAIRTFLAGVALTLGRLVTDYEHLPKPPPGSRKLAWFVGKLPAYALLIARQKFRRAFFSSGKATTPQGKNILASLQTDGIVGLQLSDAKLQELEKLLQPWFLQLEARLNQKDPTQRHFDESRFKLTRQSAPKIFDWFTAELEKSGVLDAASAYLGRPVHVGGIQPQINTPQDRFWGHHFEDIGLQSSRCDNCHLDATYNLLKVLFYLSDVGPDNGPFTVIPRTHRLASGGWDGFVRRANDYATLSHTDPLHRRLFAALPKCLQKKAAFGTDLLLGDRFEQEILASEWAVTGSKGLGAIFDPNGIHRGGLVQEGERRNVTLTLTE